MRHSQTRQHPLLGKAQVVTLITSKTCTECCTLAADPSKPTPTLSGPSRTSFSSPAVGLGPQTVRTQRPTHHMCSHGACDQRQPARRTAAGQMKVMTSCTPILVGPCGTVLSSLVRACSSPSTNVTWPSPAIRPLTCSPRSSHRRSAARTWCLKVPSGPHTPQQAKSSPVSILQICGQNDVAIRPARGLGGRVAGPSTQEPLTIKAATSGVPRPKLVGSTALRTLSMCCSMTHL